MNHCGHDEAYRLAPDDRREDDWCTRCGSYRPVGSPFWRQPLWYGTAQPDDERSPDKPQAPGQTVRLAELAKTVARHGDRIDKLVEFRQLLLLSLRQLVDEQDG